MPPPPATTPAITAEGIGHAYADGRKVLDRLSIEVPAGRFFIIIGPNGSGKTTLLKLMAHLLTLQEGRIAIMGRAVSRYGARRLARAIAYVPQNVPTTFAFTVAQVVMMGRAPHLGMLGIEGAADLEIGREAMAMAGVAHLADRRLDRLSGGERQRVSIARAICQQPRIMLLDEPTATLDPAHQVRVMDLMERLGREQGLTVVMVSHDLNLAAMYADQVLLLNQGRTAGLGPPSEVLDYARLETVYGCPLLVDQSPLGNYPRVHLVPGRHLKP